MHTHPKKSCHHSSSKQQVININTHTNKKRAIKRNENPTTTKTHKQQGKTNQKQTPSTQNN